VTARHGPSRYFHLELSPNCRAAQDKPSAEHVCTGCRDCRCHSASPPANFRELAQRQRERAAEKRAQQDGGETA
jgi:hypothetical protein